MVLDLEGAKGNEIAEAFARDFSDRGMRVEVLTVQGLANGTLADLYQGRVAWCRDKHPASCTETEMYHGTHSANLPFIYQHGLQPPADCTPDPDCSAGGGGGASTTLCRTACGQCTGRHGWQRCHMFGLGVYVADDASKSHMYTDPAETGYAYRRDGQEVVRHLLRVRVVSGAAYALDGELARPDAMHDVVHCADPRERFCPRGPCPSWGAHDAYYALGQGSMAKDGLSVARTECVLFHPWQVLPLYQITYTVKGEQWD